MTTYVILVTDKIYSKTRRYLEKIRSFITTNTNIILARPEGFSEGLDVDTVSDLIFDSIAGSVQSLSEVIKYKYCCGDHNTRILALNQSSILPALAIMKLLNLPTRLGVIESCDKSKMRSLLSSKKSDLSLDYCDAIPGIHDSSNNYFYSEKYVVKPSFGMSSCDVKIFTNWEDAKNYAESDLNTRKWVPSHVTEALFPNIKETDHRIIEPYIEGTEFSIDGWIQEGKLFSIVQHKLYMLRESFIGDGLTISPPISHNNLPCKWLGLINSEKVICEFGKSVLDALGFSKGVFHIEGIEQRSDARLKLIEVNPRAPGGSLWKSALLRSGFDLEIIDAMIQMDILVPEPNTQTKKYVFHLPLYAHAPGKLTSWADFINNPTLASHQISVDFAVPLNTVFQEHDLIEEPYLAFVVGYDDTLDGIIEKYNHIMELTPPLVIQNKIHTSQLW